MKKKSIYRKVMKKMIEIRKERISIMKKVVIC